MVNELELGFLVHLPAHRDFARTGLSLSGDLRTEEAWVNISGRKRGEDVEEEAGEAECPRGMVLQRPQRAEGTDLMREIEVERG